MVVKIFNKGQELSGKVIYNFNIIADIILVRFDRCFGEAEKDVVLMKEQSSQAWLDEENLSVRYPELIQQLHYKLRNVFNEAARTSEAALV